jgi:hypothetical protein
MCSRRIRRVKNLEDTQDTVLEEMLGADVDVGRF